MSKKQETSAEGPKNDFEVTITAEIVDETEETYTINAGSYGEAAKIALEKFEAEYRISDTNAVEIKVLQYDN